MAWRGPLPGDLVVRNGYVTPHFVIDVQTQKYAGAWEEILAWVLTDGRLDKFNFGQITYFKSEWTIINAYR